MFFGAFAYPYPGKSTSMSFPERSKKLIYWVRPGTFEVRARLVCGVRALIKLDLPTFDRPAKAISGMEALGRPEISTAPVTNVQV